jgi:hypothetical protein
MTHPPPSANVRDVAQTPSPPHCSAATFAPWCVDAVETPRVSENPASDLSRIGERDGTMVKSLEERIATLREAIAAQEGARATLGDAVADATIAALKEHQCWSFEIRSRPAST